MSHLLAFVFGVLTGVAISKVGSGDFTANSTPIPGASQPTASQSAAIQQLEAHLSHAPNDVEAHIEMGNAYFDAGNNESAIIHYAKALDLKPGDPDVIVDLGICYRRIGQSDVCVRKFIEALAIDPGHLNARMNLGLVLMADLNDFKGAIAAWDTLLTIAPNHPRAEWVRQQIAQMKMAGEVK